MCIVGIGPLTAAIPEDAIEHHDAVPALIEPTGAAGLLDNLDDDKDNQSHLSDSRREGNPEESLLMYKLMLWCLQRDQKLTLVQRKNTLGIYLPRKSRKRQSPSSVRRPPTTPDEEEDPGEDQPRRSRRRRRRSRERICYPTKTQNKTKKQKSQAK